RKFLQLTALSGVGLALGYIFISGKVPKIAHAGIVDESLEAEVNPYIFIDKNGKITLFNHRPEMGQGTYESIPMIIAEELEVDINNVNILPSPANSEKYGDQMVVGSRSINNNYDLMRKIGASAKEMFVTAAAARWSIKGDQCYAENGFVINRNTKAKFSYGKLVDDVRKIPAPENPILKDPKDFKIIGQSIPRKDIPLKTNGEAKFGIDIQVPGMLYASVERSPVLLGKLISFHDEKARAVPGVKYVLKTQRTVFGQKREGVAVIADTYWAATQGRKLLEVKWDNADLESWNTQKIREKYLQASIEEGELFDYKGDAKKVISNAAIKIEASYETPYQTHAPMEPMNVVVSVENNKCEFWGSTQHPNGVKSFLSTQLGIPEENVKINYTFMGGGFGKRSMTDVAEEAANLSKQVGAPVKVIWSREDDLTQGPFRACQLNVCSGAVDNDGNVMALTHKVISQEIHEQYNNATKASGACLGGINTEYAIPNFAISAVLQQLYIPIYYWRSVYHSTNCFAHESFMDELAHAAKKDPLDFRRSLLKQHARYTKLLQTVAEKSRWYEARDKNTGKGVAIVERSGAHVAMVAEVKNVEGKIKLSKITMAIDCGTPVHPDNIKAQMEGCIVMGLTAAYGGIIIQNGKVLEENFDTYKMLGIHECPGIEVYVIPSTGPPEGAGEAALPTVAPALCNAIFDLTKKRIRSLPFSLEEV
ncbi:MAG: molybdopterin cofactor-binding domain-containing protein, partial [Panacibacter sp.]